MRKPRARRSRPHLILYWDPPISGSQPDAGSADPPPGAAIGPHLLEGFTQALKPRHRTDLATALVEGFLGGQGEGFQLRSGWSFGPHISAAATQLGAGHRQFVGEQHGWNVLGALAEEVRTMMRTVADRRDPAFWYALLVRAQPVMISWLDNAAKIALPEIAAVALTSPRRSTLMGFLTAPWRVPPSVMTDLDQLIYLGLVLANVEIAKRRVGKGQQVALNHEVLFVGMFDPDTDVAHAIDLFDERAAAGYHGPAAALGAYGSSLAPLTADWPIIVWGSLIAQDTIRGPLLRQALRDWDPVVPMVADLKQVVPAAFLPGSLGLTDKVQAVAVFLKAYNELVMARNAVRRFSRRAWSRFGYAVRTRQEFTRAFRKAAVGHPVLGDGWLGGGADEAVELLTSAGLIRPVGRRHLILNGAMASTALTAGFNRPADGDAANVWSGAFEDEVQALIDMSLWRPPEQYRPLIRRNIRVDGTVITDVDAVAYHDGVLLLIDCKSYKSNDRLEVGEYSAVKSLREKAEKAWSSWANRIAVIDGHREQLPVQVDDTVSIAGVVVLPFTPYLLPGETTGFTTGSLRRVSSVGELLLFLTGWKLTEEG
ncbi:hypothetical protein [Actinoplanes sp. GCM10030250]|uniref:hypothetical protein n=1 Tax=Actinoplanes sp. GCM10030250 TaxID=3273376 RepID=UPI0036100AEB